MKNTDCIYFDYEEDMGKSIPYCKVKKYKCTSCMCDKESNYIDDCDNCDNYVRKDYSFLKSVVNTLPESYEKGGTENDTQD